VGGGQLSAVRKIVVLCAVAGIAAAAWLQVDQLRSGGREDALAASGVTEYPGDRGVPLPSVSGRTIEGELLSLDDLRGAVLVINVWGSWCAPCRAEAPDLVEVASDTASRGVRFVGIDVRDNPSAAQAFARNFDVGYPSLDDQRGLLLAQFTGIIPVSAVPSTLVVDAGGTIRARVVGRVDASTLRALIDDAETAS